jgi:hypothetical protein
MRRDSFDGEIVRLGRARSEEYFGRIRSNRIRDLLSGSFNTAVSCRTVNMMASMRIAGVPLSHDAVHRIQNTPIHCRGRGVVQIDAIWGENWFYLAVHDFKVNTKMKTVIVLIQTFKQLSPTGG